MKNKITATLCLALACVLLFMMTGCGLKNGYHAAYFSSIDDAVQALSDVNGYENIDNSSYSHLGLPADERFIDADYIFASNMLNVSPNPVTDQLVLTVYKVDIDGDFVYVIFSQLAPQGVGRTENGFGVNLSDYDCKRYDGKISEFHTFLMVTKEKTAPYYDNGYEPVGYITEFTNHSTRVEASEWMENSCVSFTLWHKNAEVFHSEFAFWAIYDTRDVSQAEKEALASELMEILYNNYKLAGEKAE